MVAIFREYERLVTEAEARTRAVESQLQREHNLVAAFTMLGRDRGFTEADARARWKEAGYGGL